jgi:hypothetical protein
MSTHLADDRIRFWGDRKTASVGDASIPRLAADRRALRDDHHHQRDDAADDRPGVLLVPAGPRGLGTGHDG